MLSAFTERFIFQFVKLAYRNDVGLQQKLFILENS
jgi:hypothetical protein